MKVVALWRYPVKSMQGEAIDAAVIGRQGIVGDRHWAIRDLATGRTLTARRQPALLLAWGSVVDDQVVVRLPDGTTTTDDDVLSDWLGCAVALVEAGEDDSGHYEAPEDNFDEETAGWLEWEGPPGSFHDSTRAQVSLVSTASLGDREPRRFRQNVIVAGEGEDDFVGSHLRVGSAVIEVRRHIDRCVVVTRPQPGLDRDLGVLKEINANRAGNLGIGGVVVEPGTVAVGDSVGLSS